MLKKIILLFTIFIPSFVFGTTVFDVYADKMEVFEGENIKLIVEISENFKDSDEFQLPKIEDFLILSKKNYKKEGQIYVYEYVVKPKTDGFFTIPQMTVYDEGDKKIFSKPIEIKVNKTQIIQASYTNSDENTFVKAYVDTNAAYVNQQVYYTLEFATRYELDSNPSYILPMFRDFWKNNSQTKSGYSLINGENYFTFTVTTQLYPMRDGDIIIDPSVVEAKYINGKNKYSFKTNPIKIKVFALPEKNIPGNFTGAVGRYYISASVNKINIKVNEPVHLTVNIKGTGNINSITEPVFELASDMKKYATFVNVEKDSLMSSKKFQTVLIPLMSGKKNIPEIAFSYFDTDSKNYVTIKSDSLSFEVSETIYDNSQLNIQADSDYAIPENFRAVRDDIRIKQYKKDFIKNKFLITLLILAAIFSAVSLIYRIVIIYTQKDYEKIKKLIAYKKSIKYLKDSYENLSKQDQINFYTNLDYSIRMFLRFKTSREYINISKTEIAQRLKDSDTDNEIIKYILDILKECEMYKFKAVKADVSDMNKSYQRVKSVIKEKIL